MEFNIIGSVAKIQLEESNSFIQLDDAFKLTGNQTFLAQNLISEEFINAIGGINLRTLLGSNYIFGKFRSSETINDMEVYKLLDNYNGYIQGVLLSLWFIKDNSVNVPSLYLHSLSNKGTINNSRFNLFSTSKGEYVNTEFSNQEILQAIGWLQKISDYLVIDEEKESTDSLNIKETHYENNNKNIPYDQFGRISRALTFLQLARKESFLPLKITGYVGVLETLFSSDNNEVSHQIAERVALILDDGYKNKIENYKFIKKIYNIRSNYIHGSKFNNKKYQEMEHMCPELDEIVRIIMKKVLSEMSDTNNASVDEINNLFLNKIFHVSK